MKFHKSKKDILYGNIPEQIILFTMPAFGAYLLQQLYQIVDSIVLGRYVGVQAMAAVGGSATMVINIVLNIISGIATGVMILVAQSYGKGSAESVSGTVKTGMFVSVVFGGLITLLGIALSKPILILMKCPVDTLADSLIYMYCYFAGIIFYTIYTIGIFILRAAGDSKVTLFFTIIIAVVKIFLDLLLTANLKLGVLGVGIATLVSYMVCAIVVLVMLNNTTNVYHYSLKEFGFEKNILVNIFKIGFPISIQSAVFAITSAYVSVRLNEQGTNAIAAFSAYVNVDNFYWDFSNAMGAAILTIAGQNYGNKNYKRVKETVRSGMIVQLVGTIIISSLIYLFAPSLQKMFTTDTNVINLAVKMNRLDALMYWAYIPIEVLSGALKGCGYSVGSMTIALIGICAVRFVYLTVMNFTNPIQVMQTYPISWVICGTMYTVYYLLVLRKRLSNND